MCLPLATVATDARARRHVPPSLSDRDPTNSHLQLPMMAAPSRSLNSLPHGCGQVPPAVDVLRRTAVLYGGGLRARRSAEPESCGCHSAHDQPSLLYSCSSVSFGMLPAPGMLQLMRCRSSVVAAGLYFWPTYAEAAETQLRSRSTVSVNVPKPQTAGSRAGRRYVCACVCVCVGGEASFWSTVLTGRLVGCFRTCQPSPTWWVCPVERS